MITFDCVADPSTFAAFQSKVIGKREVYDAGIHELGLRDVKKNKIDPKVLVSFFGQSLQNKINDIKNKN